MGKRTVLSLVKNLLRPYKHAAIRKAGKLFPGKKKLVFVFGGRTQIWAGIGKEYYASEPVFRESIRQSDEIIRELGGLSILPNFEGTVDETFFEDESLFIFTLTSLQMAIFDLFKSKGILPNAVMGVSLGEMGAFYAAGGLNRRDTLWVCNSMVRMSKLEKREFIPIYLQTGMSKAENICKIAPVFISPIFEVSDQGILALASQKNKEAIGKFLTEQGIQWSIPHYNSIFPYHTFHMERHKDLLCGVSDNTSVQPLQCDFYSCMTGSVLPANSVAHDTFWFDMARKPLLTHTALQKVFQDGGNILVNIGSPAFLKGQMIRSIPGGGKNVELLDTMRKGESDIGIFNTTASQLRAWKFHPTYVKRAEDLKGLDNFLPHFSFANSHFQENPYSYLEYLRREGSVHFLPKHDLWMVLNYNDVEYVLKHPELFSSTIHKTFDEALVGADPPSHTLVRSLVQPLFSPEVFSSLGAFTIEYGNKLLDQVEDREFNLVEEFSLPLAQAVVARFMGLTDNETSLLSKGITGHVYAMEYLENLRIYFSQHLKEKPRVKDNSAASILLSAYDDGKISFEGAVSLMRLLWIAGMTTTSMLLSNAAYMIANDPELKMKLIKDPELIGKFIEECLRLESPEADLKRITTKEVELGNKKIPAGATVMLSLAAANRDPVQFEKPSEILFDRPVKKHFAFGGGYHYCLGVGMARIEAKYAIKLLLNRLPDLIIQEKTKPSYFPSQHFRGLGSLTVLNRPSKMPIKDLA